MPRTTDPPVSEAQRRWAFANQNKSNAAREFAKSDPGGKLPEKVKDMTEQDALSRTAQAQMQRNQQATRPQPSRLPARPMGSMTRTALAQMQRNLQMNKSRDVEDPKPTTGPMSTQGPNGSSENLPKTTEPFGAKDNSVGKEMSLKDIKDCYDRNSMDKRR